MTATALSRTLHAPLLLTSKDRLEQPVKAFITRHRPTTAVIVGGPAAVSAEVEASILAMNEIQSVVRHSGVDRYATAAEVAIAIGDPAQLCGTVMPTVIMTTGRNYPDALVAGPLAYRGPHPILLTEPHKLPDPIRAWLASSATRHVIIIGGESTVSNSVLYELRSLGLTAERLSGADRADTSAAVARRLTSPGSANGCFRNDAVGLATGWAFPDALAAGPLLGRYGAPLLLTGPNGVPQPLVDYFAAGLLIPGSDLPSITVIGGRTVVPAAHYNQLLASLPR